jgi:ABC-type multidrug transport system fused ATPase/permease subunit
MILVTLASNIGYYYAIRYLYGVIEAHSGSTEPIWNELANFTMYMLLPDSIFIIRYILITIFTVKTAKIIHHKMMIKAVHGDLLNFYDKIHTSRLINRFSNDMTMIETSMQDPLLTTIMFLCFLIMEIIFLSFCAKLKKDLN